MHAGYEERIEQSSLLERSAQTMLIAAPEIISVPGSDKVLTTVAADNGQRHFFRAHHWLEGFYPIEEDELADTDWLSQVLARMHGAPVPAPANYRPTPYRSPDWQHWLSVGAMQHASWLTELASVSDCIKEFEVLIERWEQLSPSRPLVPSHRDLTGKNILSNGGERVVADWDSATWLHEALQDVFTVAIDWSGVRQGRLAEDRLLGTVRGYLKYADYQLPYDDVQLYCSDWAMGVLPWLAYNLERSFSPDDTQRQRGIAEAHHMLSLVAQVGKWTFDRAQDLTIA